MKNAKFVIMLQVCFLIGIFVFSASAVYQPEQIAPCATTNLALRQDGLELASLEELEAYQFSYDALDNFTEIADILKSGKAIKNRENVEVIHGADTDNPVYLISFTCTQEGSKKGKQFFYIMALKDPQLLEITNLVNKDSKEISEALGVFIAPSLIKPLTDVVEAGKTSSAGTLTQDLDDLVEKLASDKDPKVQIDAIREIVQMSPYTIYEVEEDIFRLIEEGTPSVQKEALFAIIARREPLDAFPILNTLIELLESPDSATRSNAVVAIVNTGIKAIPALKERAKTANAKLLTVIEDANRRILQEAPLARTSSAGIAESDLLIAIFSQLEEYKSSGNPYILQDALRALSDMGPAAYQILPDLKILHDAETDSILQASIELTIQKISPSDTSQKASSAGIADYKEIIVSSLVTLQSPENLYAKEREETIKSMKQGITGLLAYLGYQDASLRKAAIDAMVEIRSDIESALDIIGQVPGYEKYADTMRGMLGNIESFRGGYPFGIQSRDSSPETYAGLFGSLADKDANINHNAINMINLEAAGLELEKLQEQLEEAERKQDNGIQVPVDVMTKLIRSVSAVELKLLALQREKYILDMQEGSGKASSSGIDQATQIKEQIEVAQVYMDNLTSQLEKAMVKRDIASQEYAANDFIVADIEVEKLKESIALHQKYITDRVDAIAGILNKQNSIKASSAGYNKDILDAMTYLSGFTDVFTNTSTIPELNTDMLLRQLEAYKETVDKLETIKSQSPDAAIAVAEQANQVQASLDTMTAVQNIAAEDAALEDVTGTILVNDNDIPDNQKILLTMLDKASPYLEALETKLGCKVRLQSQYNPKSDGAANIIAISSMPVDGITRRIDIKSVTEDGYLPLEQVIVLAKGLLTYSQETKPVLDGIIAQMYRFITKAPISPKLLEAFLRNSVFILDLPIPLAIDEAYYEQLHRQALAALIAA